MRKAGPKAKVAKREDEEFGLTRRTASEFLGFHGTSSVRKKLIIRTHPSDLFLTYSYTRALQHSIQPLDALESICPSCE